MLFCLNPFERGDFNIPANLSQCSPARSSPAVVLQWTGAFVTPPTPEVASMRLSADLGLGSVATLNAGVGVYLADFATANDDTVDYHDQVAAAFATGREVIIRAGEWFNLETGLATPANSRIRCEDPDNGGFWLNMATGPGITFGDGSRVRGLSAKSTAFPSSAIAFDGNYILGARRLVSGDSCWFDDIYLSDLAGGLDIDGVSGVTLNNIHGEDIRSRSGWGAVIHCTTGASNVVGIGIYGTDCDRFIEVERACHDISFTTGTATGIYPVGYVGQPGAEAGSEIYANYSFVLDLGHAHTGEGGCYNISYSGFTITNCLSAISALRSTGTNLSDLSHDLVATDIIINTPRTAIPITLQGFNILIDGVTFGGTRNGAINPLIKTLAATGSDNIVCNDITTPDLWYAQPVVQFQGAGSELTNSNFGTRSNATTNTFYVFRCEANNCVFDNIFVKQPTYSLAVYYFAAGTSGNSRTNTTYTDAAANDPGAAVEYSGTTVTESGNQDGIAA